LGPPNILEASIAKMLKYKIQLNSRYGHVLAFGIIFSAGVVYGYRTL